MNVLIIGRGGREHALAWKISQDPKINNVYVAPGNVGMNGKILRINIEENDIEELISFAKNSEVSLTIVGPEVPLINGIVNDFQDAGLTIFGPTKEAAEIEGSKAFAKELMKKYMIPTASYEIFTDFDQAIKHIEELTAPIVVKADGLAAGKGVVVAMSIDEAKQAAYEMLKEGKFGESSNRIVIEEFLDGQEYSLMAFVNGENVYPMVIAQDHKRAYDNDTGPNTGGMGAYSPVPQISYTSIHSAIDNVLKPVASAMVQEGRSFTGILYAGLIDTINGPKVIEFNARFGDPETEVVIPRLENELADVIIDVLQGNDPNLIWSDEAVVGVVMAANGYPDNPERGLVIEGLDELEKDTFIFHAGTGYSGGNLVTNGGRVLVVASKASNLGRAYEHVYKELSKVKSDGLFYRKDIAQKAIIYTK
jgi:phosphoribosylamine--glycine ligase